MKKEARPMKEKFHIRSRPDLCVLRSINDVAVFVRAANQYGIDSSELLAGSGIEIEELDDPHRIIPIVLSPLRRKLRSAADWLNFHPCRG